MFTRETLLRELFNSVLVICGILLAALGLKGFLLSSGFIDGGVTGVSMLLAKVTSLPLSIWLPLCNLPFLYLAYRSVGLAFAIRSTLSIAGLSLALALLHFPDITPDHLLTAIFGGFFIGAGIGLAIRGGAVLDGTEIAALLISKRSGMLKVGDVILMLNIILFVAALSLLNTDQVLFSILTYVSAAKTLDFVIYGVEEFTAINILSHQSNSIREAITDTLGRGVTVIPAIGGKSQTECEILYCVVTRLEVGDVRRIVAAHDPSAFLTIHPLASADGGVIRRSGIH